jgi:hypothetical protein
MLVPGSSGKPRNPKLDNPQRPAEQVPHHSAHQGSPLGFGIADRGGIGFRFWIVRRDGWASGQNGLPRRNDFASPHRLALTSCARRLQRPHNDMPFREPNRIAVKILRNTSVRPEESAPLLSRATNLGGRIPTGIETNRVNLEAYGRSSNAFEILQTRGAGPSPLRLTKARLRDSGGHVERDGVSGQDGMSRRTRPCISPSSRADKLPGSNTPPIQRPAVPRAEHPRCLNLQRSFREARGIGPAALKGYQFWRTHADLLGLRLRLRGKIFF